MRHPICFSIDVLDFSVDELLKKLFDIDCHQHNIYQFTFNQYPVIFSYFAAFQFSSSSVCEVTKQEFDSCNTNNALLRSTTGNTTFPLTKPGDRYFANCNRLYCLGGMKLHVHVEPNSTTAATTAGAPEAALGPATAGAGLLPRTSKSNHPVLSSSAGFLKVGNGFFLFLLGFLGLLSILGWGVIIWELFLVVCLTIYTLVENVFYALEIRNTNYCWKEIYIYTLHIVLHTTDCVFWYLEEQALPFCFNYQTRIMPWDLDRDASPSSKEGNGPCQAHVFWAWTGSAHGKPICFMLDWAQIFKKVA